MVPILEAIASAGDLVRLRASLADLVPEAGPPHVFPPDGLLGIAARGAGSRA